MDSLALLTPERLPVVFLPFGRYSRVRLVSGFPSYMV